MFRVMLSALVCLAPFASACAESEAAPNATRTAVRVATVGGSAADPDARYSGTLEPESKVDVAFRAGGYVESVGTVGAGPDRRELDVGDFVAKGTILAKLKAADYTQKVASARARQAEAKASATLAKQELDRTTRLHDAKVVSLAELEAKTAQRDAALASVEAAAAQAAEASVALGDTVLRAPSDGVILSRRIEAGTLASPGGVAFVIADTRNVKVVFGAPQQLVERLAIGHDVTVILGAAGAERDRARTVTSSITRIAPAAEKTGRLFTVESTLPNADGALRPGSVVTVRVPEGASQTKSLVVPLGAILRSPTDARGFALYVVDGTGTTGAAHLREVALGPFVGNGVVVESGVSSGDRVVTTGAALLRDGAEAVVIP